MPELCTYLCPLCGGAMYRDTVQDPASDAPPMVHCDGEGDEESWPFACAFQDWVYEPWVLKVIELKEKAK